MGPQPGHQRCRLAAGHRCGPPNPAGAGLPVLFVEVDSCTETPGVLAAKFEKYRAFFRLKTKTPRA
ncbi:replication-relaxation family protein [Streptomyces aurantiacus]